MAPKKKDALAEYEQLREAAKQADLDLDAAEQAALAGRRSLDSVKAPLREYHEQVGAREREPDEELEARLAADVRAAERLVTLKPAFTDPRSVALVAHDDKAEALLTGARRARDQAWNAVYRFIEQNRDRLVAALLPRAEQARDRLLAAVDELDTSEREWNETRAAWAPMIERWNVSPAELPASPVAGGTQEIARSLASQHGPQLRDRRRLVPAPVSLLPGPEVEQDDDTMRDAAGKAPKVTDPRGDPWVRR